MNTEALVLTIGIVVVLVMVSAVVAMARMLKRVQTIGQTDGELLPPSLDATVLGRVDELSSKVSESHGALTTQIQQFDSKLAVVQRSVDEREGAINDQMGKIGNQVASIVSLFNNDRARGSWGELSLERIFEVAGMVEGRDYINQFGEGDGRPDVVVLLPGDRKIVIDSKFPTARYLEAMSAADEAERTKLLARHGKALEEVGKELAKKHYADTATAGYVIVYVPSQSVFEAATDAFPDVIDSLMRLNVIVAGPTSIFALIKTTATLMAEHRAVSDARKIVAEVRELRTRLGTFTDHFSKVGNGLKTAVSAFNSAISSWNGRLTPTVNRIAGMASAEEMPLLNEVEVAVTEAYPSPLREAS